MKSSLLAVIAAVASLALVSGAKADQTFNFSYTGTDPFSQTYTGTGSFVVDSSGLITSLTGTQNGVAMILDAVNQYASNDNLHPYDVGGFSFTVNGTEYNIYLNGTQIWELDDATGIYSGDGWQLLYTESVPEPASLALLGAGLVAAGFLHRKKLKNSV